VPSISSSSSGVNSSIAATSNLEWPTGTSHLFSAYDLFRCIVVLTITFGLIAGNILLAMATNCKFSASVLQFQVCSVNSFFIYYLKAFHVFVCLLFIDQHFYFVLYRFSLHKMFSLKKEKETVDSFVCFDSISSCDLVLTSSTLVIR